MLIDLDALTVQMRKGDVNAEWWQNFGVEWQHDQLLILVVGPEISTVLPGCRKLKKELCHSDDVKMYCQRWMDGDQVQKVIDVAEKALVRRLAQM